MSLAAHFPVVASADFWLNSSMPHPHDLENPAIVEKLTLNEKIILVAKEANRRHSEVAAEIGKDSNQGYGFECKSLEHAMRAELLLCKIFLRTNPNRLRDVVNYFTIRIGSIVKISTVIIDFIGNNFNSRCAEHTSLEQLKTIGQQLNQNKTLAEKIIGDWKKLSFENYVAEIAVGWTELNKINGTVFDLMDKIASLVTNCGFRREMIPLIKNSGVHHSIVDYMAYSRLKADATIVDVVFHKYSNFFSDGVYKHSPVDRCDRLATAEFNLFFSSWLSDFIRRVAAVLDPACQFSTAGGELHLICHYDELLTLFNPADLRYSPECFGSRCAFGGRGLTTRANHQN